MKKPEPLFFDGSVDLMKRSELTEVEDSKPGLHALWIKKETKMFKTGDVVILKSGGPNMTVVSISEDGSIVYCTWMPFDSSGDVYEGDFMPATIKHTETLTLDP